MYVYWLEQTEADVPPVHVPHGNDWLSAEETVHFNTLRFAKRSADWRLGRWTAKRAIASLLNLPAHPQALANIEIWPAPSGAPEAFVENVPAPAAISISHRDGMALCAIALSPPDLDPDLGCDLEIIEPRSDAFVADYFAPEEQTLIAHFSAVDRSRILALLWSAKESTLKALREGLRFDTRSVIVRLGHDWSCDDSPDLNQWSPLQVQCVDRQPFHGWWRSKMGIVRTVVANPPPDPPIPLILCANSPQEESFDIQMRKQMAKGATSTVPR